VRGSSCVPCTLDTDCDGQSPAACAADADCIDGARCESRKCTAMCEVVGRICADAQTEAECTDDDLLTCLPSEVAAAQRCHDNKDCEHPKKCIERARVACNSCVTAAWKLRATGELYDLASNPEEDQKLFRRDGDGNGRLNCFQQAAPGHVLSPCFAPRSGSAAQKLCNVQETLTTALSRWTKCVTTPTCAFPGCADCENDVCDAAPVSCK
jgi:hypothetical protein